MAASLIDPEPLLAPLADDAPCGADLEYDPEFQALERAGAGTPERQYGDKIFPAEPPEWLQVHELAVALAERSRDLRVAVWLTRAGARLQGLPGAARGLQLVLGMLERHWTAVHPQLDASDNNDPTMRLNALMPLVALDAVLADLRAAGLAQARGSLTLRELELGMGAAEPHGDEAQPTEAGVLQGLAGLVQSHPDAAEAIQAASAAAQGIVDVVESQVGSAAPDLSPLTRLLGTARRALDKLQAAEAEAAADEGMAGGASDGGGGGGFAVAGGGALRNRTDVQRELERLCEWFERNEPSHPAPLLLRRAQRLLGMSFLEIINDMAPNGIDQVQVIAGPQPESSE
jgi:type VI secretion system protein ImpA